jgi:hypothetical protein
MTKPSRLILAGLTLLLLRVTIASSENEPIDLKLLEGDWEGSGEFLVPVTNISMSVEGRARFDFDSAAGHLRTSLTGEKYLFTYTDSGHLKLDKQTDSISWEVWDNLGKHALYHGRVSGSTITGHRFRKKNLYRVMIELVTIDSIDFKLTVTEPDGDRYEKASFNLWRIKE